MPALCDCALKKSIVFPSMFIVICRFSCFAYGFFLGFRLLTGGGFGIVLFIDWFTISKVIRERNYDKLLAYLY